MIIRRFDPADYLGVLDLLKSEGVEPPVEVEELAGPCYVAVSGDTIAGMIFALTGESSKAYVDYLAVSKEFHGSFVFFRLLTALEKDLQRRGVKRYVFHVEKHNVDTFNQLFKYRERYGVVMLRSLDYFSKEVGK